MGSHCAMLANKVVPESSERDKCNELQPANLDNTMDDLFFIYLYVHFA